MSKRITDWCQQLIRRMQSVSESGTSSQMNIESDLPSASERPSEMTDRNQKINVQLSRGLFLELQQWAFSAAAFRAAKKHALSYEENSIAAAARYEELIEDMEAIERTAKEAGWT